MSVRIYINKNDETTGFARQELITYLSRMDGGHTYEPVESEPAEFVLKVEEALNEGLADPELDEKIEIRVQGGSGSICGNNPRALLAAVYRFLNEAGCRFLRPGQAYEIVPEKDITGIEVKLSETPSFRHRGVCIEGADTLQNVKDFIDWLPKTGYNSFFVQFENPYSFFKRWYEHEFNPYLEKEPFSTEIAQRMSDEVDAELKKRSLLHHRVGHGWTGEVLGYSSRYGWQREKSLKEESRQYAALLNGKRDFFDSAPILTSLCFSNQEVLEKMTDLIVDYAGRHRDVDYLHVWLSDAENNVCECEECQKEILSDQYVTLLNLLDQKLAKAGLDTRICFLLYHELLYAPQVNKIENPDRYVMMFAPISRTFEKSYADVDYEQGIGEPAPYVRNRMKLPNSLEENLGYLFQWQKVFGGDSFVYDYPLGRAHYGDLGYVDISKTIYRDIRYLGNLNLNGYISCQELRAGLPTNFPNYVMGKMLWDNTLDYDKLAEEYFTAAFGADGLKAYAYLEEISKLSSCDYFNAIGERINPELFSRYQKITELCGGFLPEIKKHIIGETGLVKQFWEVLSYHREYCMILSEGLAELCRDNKEAGQKKWEEFLHYIRINESSHQDYLDVYRVIEVAKNYAGFTLAD